MLKISKCHVSVGKKFPASPHILWDLITDTTQWPRWGPTVKAVRNSERYICKGSGGQVLTAVGIWLPFVVADFEHESFWSWKVASVKATGHRLQLTETGECLLWFEVPLIVAPYIVICHLALKRIEEILSP